MPHSLRLPFLCVCLALLPGCATDFIDDYKIPAIESYWKAPDKPVADLAPFHVNGAHVHLALKHDGYKFFTLSATCVIGDPTVEVLLLDARIDKLPGAKLDSPRIFKCSRPLGKGSLLVGEEPVSTKLPTSDLLALTVEAPHTLQGSLTVRVTRQGTVVEQTVPVCFKRIRRTYTTMR